MEIVALRRKILRDDVALAALGGPRVIIDRLPSETRVWLDRKVFGLANADKVFLGRGSTSAMRYAEALFTDLVGRAASRMSYRSGSKARNAAGRAAARMICRGEAR